MHDSYMQGWACKTQSPHQVPEQGVAHVRTAVLSELDVRSEVRNCTVRTLFAVLVVLHVWQPWSEVAQRCT